MRGAVVNDRPLEDVVALADVGQRPRRVVRVGADKQADAGAPHLLPLAELVELGTRRDQHLAGPVADLDEEDAGGLAVGEEDADGLAGQAFDLPEPVVHWAHPEQEGRSPGATASDHPAAVSRRRSATAHVGRCQQEAQAHA